MTATERRQRVRAILAGGACVHPASVFDPVSARLAAGIGFEMGMLAGSIASFTVLGAPDLVLLTLTEFAEQIRRICRAAPLPLLVDADHGYGNALNAMRTVQELEAAGVAALTIEDTQLPTPFGAAGPALISREEGVGKLRAALAAREDPATVIVARTSAAGIAGVDEAIARARLYAPLGPDALFLTGIKDARGAARRRRGRAAADHPGRRRRWEWTARGWRRTACGSRCKGTSPSPRRWRPSGRRCRPCATARRPSSLPVSRRRA